jgi:hypothetical protein
MQKDRIGCEPNGSVTCRALRWCRKGAHLSEPGCATTYNCHRPAASGQQTEGGFHGPVTEDNVVTPKLLNHQCCVAGWWPPPLVAHRRTA